MWSAESIGHAEEDELAAKEGGIYVCDMCGQIVVVKKSGAGTLVCCNQPMRLMEK